MHGVTMNIIDARCNHDIIDARCKHDIIDARCNHEVFQSFSVVYA